MKQWTELLQRGRQTQPDVKEEVDAFGIYPTTILQLLSFWLTAVQA